MCVRNALLNMHFSELQQRKPQTESVMSLNHML